MPRRFFRQLSRTSRRTSIPNLRSPGLTSQCNVIGTEEPRKLLLRLACLNAYEAILGILGGDDGEVWMSLQYWNYIVSKITTRSAAGCVPGVKCAH